MPGTPALHDAAFYAQYIGATSLLVVDGSVHTSDALAPGRYAILCADTSIYVRQGADSVAVDATCLLLPEESLLFFNVDDDTNNRVSVTTATGLGGTARITRVDGTTGAVATHKAQYLVQYLGPATKLALVPTVMQRNVLALGPGRYLVVCLETSVYLRQGDDTVNADANQMWLPAGEGFYVNVDDTTNDFIAGLVTGADNGTLQIVRVDSV